MQEYRIDLPPGAIEVLDTQLLIVNDEKSTYYLFNDEATLIWEMLSHNVRTERIIQAFHFEEDLEISKEISRFLARLEKEKLIHKTPLENNGKTSYKNLPFEVPFIEKFSSMKDLAIASIRHHIEEDLK